MQRDDLHHILVEFKIANKFYWAAVGALLYDFIE
jgi:hypothetical protein